ncbi:Methyltransf-21 domain-containing protein [Aphelenchoides besseyi]|nr:Methyltransf-21 domain-containing protein [Aphelenchoides besseyi]KAI6198817.1 Methyltransf-21 domain-containing protein [Aphelenchoides besseyi]
MNFSYYPHRLPSVKVAAIPVTVLVILVIWIVALSGSENEVDESPQILVDDTSIEGNSQENNEEEQAIIDGISMRKSDEEEEHYDSGEYKEESQNEDINVDTTTPKVCRPPRSTPIEICPLPSSWILRSGKKCTENTNAELAAFRSLQQKYLDEWWSLNVTDDVKWTAIIGAYDQSFITLKQLFRFVSDGERKLFLDFVDRNATCNVYTWGIGGDYNGETLFYNRYPQCRFTAVDPEAVVNREIVERVPNARFIHSSIASESGTYSARIRGTNGVYTSQTVTHRGVVEFFNEYNDDNEVIDLLLIDIEGAEFSVLPKIVKAKTELPKICQINVEIHAPAEAFGTTTQRALESIHSFLSDGTYSIINVETLRRLLRVFLINTLDGECVKKFFC